MLAWVLQVFRTTLCHHRCDSYDVSIKGIVLDDKKHYSCFKWGNDGQNYCYFNSRFGQNSHCYNEKKFGRNYMKHLEIKVKKNVLENT